MFKRRMELMVALDREAAGEACEKQEDLKHFEGMGNRIC